MGQAKLAEESLGSFTDKLAARQPVPGGGGAAAYTGALASALCSMAGEYTLGKKRYEDVQDDVEDLLRRAHEARRRLVALVDEDAEAFLPLSRAFGLAKDDPARAAEIEKATAGACVAPLKMMRQVCLVIQLLEEMAEKGSQALISDVGCGAALARGALEAASLNVLVNTAALKDRDRAARLQDSCDGMLREFVPRAERLLNDVRDEIGRAR